MEIVLSNIGKRYGLNWIFRNVNYTLHSGQSYTLTGHNGSGKSTLLKILSGGLTPSEGGVQFIINGKESTPYNVAQEMAFTAPYISLIEDFTLQEMLEFHFKFKKMRTQSIDDLMDIIGLKEHEDKFISKFSSGMMQRLKLSLTILSDTEVLLLDEPTAYLDENAIQWYRELLLNHMKDRLLIIGSNQKHEYSFIDSHIIHVPDFKYVRKKFYGTKL